MNKELRKEIFYEIYPNSFKDSNNDGYGDFNGIIEKLDYVKSLGVTAIWLNPHFDSPFKDGGYDVRDYFHASSRFGTDEEFLNLVNEIHNRKMKIIIDLVAGHTSEENEMFLQSASNVENEMYDRYIWTDNPWVAPNEYFFMRGRFDRNGSYLVNFFSTQPALNYGFKEITYPWQIHYKDERVLKTRDYMVSVMEHYLSLGVDGFRVDMADSLVKNDDNKEATIEVWQDMIGRIRKKFPNAIFVAEWCNPYQSLKAGFDIDFVLDRHNDFFNDLARREDWDKDNISFLRVNSNLNIKENMLTMQNKILDNKELGYLSFISCNHDMPRPNRFLNEKELRMFYMILFTLPGVPFLYYGDEIEMIYHENLPSKECGYGRTGTRTPMVWDDSYNKGFSNALEKDLFLPIDKTTSVKQKSSEENSIYHLIKKLISLRKETEDLLGNNIEFVSCDNRMLIYKRNNLLVVINPSNTQKEIEVDYNNIIFADGNVRLENNKLVIPSQASVILGK